MAKIEELVENLVLQPIENLGYELYDVEYTKEGKNYFLRIFIDSQNGIDLNDCENVNNAISDLLDEANYIKEQYFLEVSSPGIERVLKKDKHLEKYKNQKIMVHLFKAIDGKKQIEGILNNFSKDTIEIEVENKIKIIPRCDISQIKTIYDW